MQKLIGLRRCAHAGIIHHQTVFQLT